MHTIFSYLLSLIVMALALTGVTINEVIARHPTIVTMISFSGEEEYGKWVDFDCFLNVLFVTGCGYRFIEIRSKL